ncbi:Plasmodium exported protein, unknown function [Plasmodium ovale wallikeri]|uniref:Pv-fam-d protein n=2 Tax=Plasmodium ovale TaxID=36330 RepID=A0A1A9APS1_PLAOA|nr:Plasmodium exported protein, unknown function [Plasmodium ovale wallikeri]SBT58737.1 Plasmodium exported protein, unknown function [Plasmodium ovale wallikeri]SBT74608.1 Plasmodium exported protein, unknown function [Plasmodium ovale]
MKKAIGLANTLAVSLLVWTLEYSGITYNKTSFLNSFSKTKKKINNMLEVRPSRLLWEEANIMANQEYYDFLREKLMGLSNEYNNNHGKESGDEYIREETFEERPNNFTFVKPDYENYFGEEKDALKFNDKTVKILEALRHEKKFKNDFFVTNPEKDYDNIINTLKQDEYVKLARRERRPNRFGELKDYDHTGKNSSFRKFLRFLKKTDAKIELEIIRVLNLSNRSKKYRVREKGILGKLKSIIREYKVFTPLVISTMLVALFAVTDNILIIPTFIISLLMIIYVILKLNKIDKMQRICRMRRRKTRDIYY